MSDTQRRPLSVRVSERLHGGTSEAYLWLRLHYAQLKKRMAEVAMIDVNKIPHDRVGLGSRVVILDTSKDEEITYHLVTSEDADVAAGRVSTSSPIGKSLLGKEVGDTVKLVTPGGTRELEILSLKTIHEFMTDEQRPS